MSLRIPNNVTRPNNLYHNEYNAKSPLSSATLLMRSDFSQSKDRNYNTLSSNYGKSIALDKHSTSLSSTMGIGASTRHHQPQDKETTGMHFRSRGSSLSEGALNSSRNFRYGQQSFSNSSPQIPRPLPHGPGPLLPKNSTLKINRRKTEMKTTPVKGPMKASHDFAQNTTPSPVRQHKSPLPLKALGREKSRSMNDVRAVENGQDQKPSANRMLTDVDLKKAKKSFKISRSPSCDNLNNTRQLPDERALLDKLSKLSTDSSQNRRTVTGTFNRHGQKGVNVQHSDKLKVEIPISTTCKVVSMKNKLNIAKDDVLRKEKLPISQDNKRQQSSQGNTPIVCKEPASTSRSRKLSDSAYESNSATSSESSSSSPGITRHESSLQSSGLPSGYHGDGLVGLRNLGNTCFMNSIIQCLRNTRRLRQIFCRDYFIEDLNETTAPMKGRLAKAFSSVVKEMWMTNKTGHIVSPNNLKSQVQRYAPRFTGFSQQDSQEFLRFLLEGLHDDLNIIRQKAKYEYECDSKLGDAEQAKRAWQWYAKREKSVISDLFVGQLKSTLTCAECDYRSLTFDPFWDLSLPIPSRSRTSLVSGKVSLYDCFKKFTQEEILDGDEKPTCERCKKRQKCFKRFTIERFPQILVIHLKRFSGFRYRTKLDTLVDFPLQLNLASYSAHNSVKKSEALYHLYGVSNHSGGTYSGHYTAHCKHPDTNEWIYYSDTSVMKLSPGRVVSEEGYVLFYELSNQMSYL
eukprot:gene1241-1368_t